MSLLACTGCRNPNESVRQEGCPEDQDRCAGRFRGRFLFLFDATRGGLVPSP